MKVLLYLLLLKFVVGILICCAWNSAECSLAKSSMIANRETKHKIYRRLKYLY